MLKVLLVAVTALVVPISDTVQDECPGGICQIPKEMVEHFQESYVQLQVENMMMKQKLEELRFSRNCSATVGGKWW